MAVTLAMVAGLEAGVVLEGGRRKLRSLYWRVRAEVRRQVGRGRSRKQLCSFHYDPFSYALNFDDGASGFFC